MAIWIIYTACFIYTIKDLILLVLNVNLKIVLNCRLSNQINQHDVWVKQLKL